MAKAEMMNNEPDYTDNLYFEKLQKMENVANNVANENSQDLTEQWKKGKLPEGKYYYISTIYYPEIIQNYVGRFYDWEDDEIEQILAPVPSYDELQNMNEAVNQAIAANIKLVDDNKRLKHDVGNLGYKIKNQRHEIDNRLKEIKKLKRLLTECASDFETYAKEDETCGLEEENKLAKNILPKIREVLK